MNLDQALQTFFAESRELLTTMEDALLQLERDPQHADAIASTFRAIHTIKGSAGLFGLDDIVRFAHVVESVLDRVRNGELMVDDSLSALLLESSDHIGALVDQASGGTEASPADGHERGEALLARLRALCGDAGGPKDNPLVETAAHAQGGGKEVSAGKWHISLRFGQGVLRNGMDPAPFIRYLGTLGDVVHITPVIDAMPSTAEMDPECCYLGFELAFKTEASKEAIEAVFEFVRDDCALRMIPPDSKIGEYIKLINELSESKERIGEILVASGAVTRKELDDALAAQQAEEGRRQPLGQILVADKGVSPQVVDAALEKQKQIKDKRSAEAKFVRVDASKLEYLINQVGEMVIAGASAELQARKLGDGALQETMSMMGRLIEQIRDCALSLRMVEIGETFSRFHRVVRDVSRELGKSIELELHGTETELDKTVVEKITDPLMHLVRNAMDHGIEPADVRLARGKPMTGKVSLNAFHESGSIVIEVRDDGGGLNREKIRSKAIERGIIEPSRVLTESDVLNLVFEAGFSTADQVTNLSGRGVGMDVVRRNIEALRGSVELESVEGQGTTFRIRLPLTLAIIDGFLVEVGGASFVVPLEMVVECIELTKGAGEGQREYLNLRGEVLPFIRLREMLGIDGERPNRENVVVARWGASKAGLVVDRLLGEFQTVIKPLGQMFTHLRGISGSTILGSGEVALILDVPAFLQQAAKKETEKAAVRNT